MRMGHIKLIANWAALTLLSATVMAAEPNTLVWLDTNEGPIVLAMDRDCCPRTVDNFVGHVEDGFYDGLVFHRVVRDFVIQAGGFDRNLAPRASTRNTVPGERGRSGGNRPYSVAMALVGGDPDSGRNQFYINTGDNNGLDDQFTVFGDVVFGRHVVDRINNLMTAGQDIPLGLPVIQAAHVSLGFPLMPLHSGSWFDPNKSGVGFNVEIANEAGDESGPFLLVYWYDFNNSEPLWLTGVDRFEYGASSFTLDLIHVPTPNVGVDFQAPPQRDAFEIWGQLTVRFLNCNDAQFTYEAADGRTGTLDVIRLTVPDRFSCQP